MRKVSKTYLRNWAKLDYECGHCLSIDDFRQFKKLCKDDNRTCTKEDFNLYFELLAEIKSKY